MVMPSGMPSEMPSGMKKIGWEKCQQMPLGRIDIENHAVNILIDETQLNEVWVPYFIVITLCTGKNSSHVDGR